MDISGEQRIPVCREQIWKALNNPNILRKCIPNCESVEKVSPTEMVATLKVKVTFVSATFKSTITLANLNAPESYTLVTEGSGGLIGSLKSSTDVHLREEGNETVVTYRTRAEIGGKLALLGSKMIDASARKMVTKFFERLTKIMTDKTQPTIA